MRLQFWVAIFATSMPASRTVERRFARAAHLTADALGQTMIA